MCKHSGVTRCPVTPVSLVLFAGGDIPTVTHTVTPLRSSPVLSFMTFKSDKFLVVANSTVPCGSSPVRSSLPISPTVPDWGGGVVLDHQFQNPKLDGSTDRH